MWQPYSWTFSFTIACGNITVGLCFERRLAVFPLTNACGRAVLPSGMSRFSRKPPRELLGETDSRGPLTGLKNHLMKSISGILLNLSGKVASILELTLLADSGVRALALVTAYVSTAIRYHANFSSVIQSLPYWLPYSGYSVLAYMGEFAGCAFVQWAGYRQFSPGLLLLVWASLRE